MNANKLSDALNYLDDDLISECDKVRTSSSASSAKTGKNINKAKVTRLWGSIAAAAIVLVVGAYILILNNGANKNNHHSENGSSDKVETPVFYEEAAHNDTPSAEIRETAAAIDDIEGIEVIEDDAVDSEENFSQGTFLGIDAVRGDNSVVVNEARYVVVYAEIISGDYAGARGLVDSENSQELWDYLATVTESNNSSVENLQDYTVDAYISFVESSGSEMYMEFASCEGEYAILLYYDNAIYRTYVIDQETSENLIYLLSNLV